MRRALWAGGALCAMAACGATSSGLGLVEGEFTVDQCSAASARDFPEYRYQAQHVETRRLGDRLEILLLDYPVDLEETDGLVIQFDSVAVLRAARAATAPRPLALPVAAGSSPTRAALSLFQTCPFSPTLHAVSGTVTFSRLTLAADPDDTGVDEVLTGTLAVSVSGPDRRRVAGTVRATFDFLPSRPPLLTPR